MTANRPNKAFFKKHPLEQMSPATIADFLIQTPESGEFQTKMDEILHESTISQERWALINKQRGDISILEDAETIVSTMRKPLDNMADHALCSKALEMADEVCPLIIRRFKTTALDNFTELSFRILAKADPVYTRELYSCYDSIRNPYAQSFACLLFGEHMMEEAILLLMKEYERFGREYPDESYDQGPLLALYLICDPK